ncbi:MAG: ferritin family protein [candidate division Zixibacteria bacterium]|nr:ferritin family protein [candidate division Zixibacteria bacterium]
MGDNSEILKALTRGIESEIAAYVFYLEAMKKVDDTSFKSILEHLAGEEKGHFLVLERKYDSLVRSEMWNTTTDILRKDGLPEIDENMAANHRSLIEKVRNLESKKEILDMALDLEKEAESLFAKLAENAQTEDAKAAFRNLAEFEKAHVKLIEKEISNLG